MSRMIASAHQQLSRCQVFCKKKKGTWEYEKQFLVIVYRELPSANYLMQKIA